MKQTMKFAGTTRNQNGVELSLNVSIHKCNSVFYGPGLSIRPLYEHGGHKGSLYNIYIVSQDDCVDELSNHNKLFSLLQIYILYKEK